MVYTMTFGEWVRNKRRELRLNSNECAARAGVSTPTWSRWESDGINKDGTVYQPRRETIRKIAQGLGIPLKEVQKATNGESANEDEQNEEPGNTYTYREQKGGAVNQETLSADMFIKLSQEVGFLAKRVEDGLKSIERRFEQIRPGTIVDLNNQKAIVLNDDIQKQIAELNAKIDELLKKSGEE